jgi:hypothetical protein
MEMADPRSKAGSTQPSNRLVGSYRAVGQKFRAQLCGGLGEQNDGPLCSVGRPNNGTARFVIDACLEQMF